MANRRMISKRDCERLEYFHLSLRQRYLFEHIMLEADDDGIILEKMVRHKIFPFDREIAEEDVVADLEVLVLNDFIQIYETEKEKYVYVLDWWKRQYIRLDIYQPTTCPKPIGFVSRPLDLKKSKESGKRDVTPSVTGDVTEEVTQKRRGKIRGEEQSLEEIRVDGEDLPFNSDGSINSKFL